MATGWQAHERPFAFAEAPIHFAPDAFRFLSGTPNVPALYAARPGYTIVGQIGVEAIRARSVLLTERMIAAADAAGLPVRSERDPARRGGVVVIGSDDARGPELVRGLDAAGIVIDHRPGAGLRIAPHFYTLEAEVDRTIAVLSNFMPRRL